MARPLLSVIIPAYNVEAYITETLDSLAAQTLPQERFEVIVIDDASTDGTPEKAEAYAGLEHLRILRNGRNAGPGVSRNRGIEAARGELLLFLDADDLLERSALELLAQRAAESGADLLVYDWVDYDRYRGHRNETDEHPAYHLPTGREDAVVSCLGLRGVDFTNGYRAVRRSLLTDHDLRYPEGLHEDIPMTFMIWYHAKRVETIDRKLYIRRVHDDARSSRFTEAHLDGLIGAFAAMMDHLVAQIGRKRAAAYLPYYYEGIRGMCANILKKIADHVPPARKGTFYNRLWAKLSDDRYLTADAIGHFTYRTPKDRVARVFIEKIQDNRLLMEHKIAAVEGEMIR